MGRKRPVGTLPPAPLEPMGNWQRSLNLLANCYMRPGEQLGRDAMSIFERAGSAALHKRLAAFGGVVSVLCAAGVAPVTAVVLVLCAAVVLANM